MPKDDPIISIRLKSAWLRRISQAISDTKTGRLKANPTVSEFVRMAVEEKLARLEYKRGKKGESYQQCNHCRKWRLPEEIEVACTDLFGVPAFLCKECHTEGFTL